jgi:glycosyltransferase involved in cell wall biosynthesis
MTAAPVAIFTFNRPKHTKSMLAALARNHQASQTDVVVFSDGPRSVADANAVASVRDLVRKTDGFKTLRLVERASNFGLARSIITGVSQLLETHDSIIVLEDDLLTSSGFLSFMNEALARYRDDRSAFSVTGHTFPQKYLRIPDDYAFDTYAGVRCSSWSWGTWRDRWARVDWDMTYYGAFCQNPELQTEFNRGGQDMTILLHKQQRGEINSWAIRFCYAHTANRMHCIYPVRTLVKNIGLDNSGTHSKPDPRFEHPALDDGWQPRRFCQADMVDPRIAAAFRGIFDPPRANRARCLVRKAHSSSRVAYGIARRFAGRLKRLLFQPKQAAEVLILNTYQQSGGAARAANRLFLGVRRHYAGARYLTLLRDGMEPDVFGLASTSIRGAIAQLLVRLDQLPLLRYRGRTGAIFSPARHPNPLRIRLSRFSPRLVHLHWLGRGLLRGEELAALQVPVVWTLHDSWAFTGGCHYTGACEGYTKRCGTCPHLASTEEEDLSRTVMRRKARTYASLEITVVAPSQWLAAMAARSSLFKGRRIEVIPNGLDTDAFKPIPRDIARDYLSVARDHPVVLFGAEWLPDPRKGGDLLCQALAGLERPCTLLTFGGGRLPLNGAPQVTLRSLGNLSDAASLALAYSAADVFVCPSRQDNLPNTVAEALACGTPCVAFNINGLPDMIEHRRTGWLARPFDPSDLGAGIQWVTAQPDQAALRDAARRKALTDYSLEIMTKRYCDLYAELLGR